MWKETIGERGNYFYIECENGFKCKINNSVLGYVTSTTMNLLLDISNNISGTIWLLCSFSSIRLGIYGAYYEAGYAEALGKEVIICCREDIFNGDKKPHFDIAQKSSIVWKDEEDLENRLYKRIEATVGLNNWLFC